MRKMSDDFEKKEVVHATKRCPECFTYVKLNVQKCPDCNTKLGAVEKHGMAKRKTNWMSYVSFFIAFLALAFYLWWEFL